MLDAPRLHPCADALLKVGNNAVCNARVNVFAVGLGAHGSALLNGLWVCCAHAHAPLPTGEVGGSNAQGRMFREGDLPACTSPAFGRGRLGKPGQAATALPLRGAWGSPLGSVFTTFRERDRYR